MQTLESSLRIPVVQCFDAFFYLVDLLNSLWFLRVFYKFVGGFYALATKTGCGINVKGLTIETSSRSKNLREDLFACWVTLVGAGDYL